MALLSRQFFAGSAPQVAHALLGCLLVHETRAGRTVGRIVETEAYDQTDPASHSARGRTPRNQAMFGRGGVSYVYRSYGVHWCMNVSCGPFDYGAAVLFRALEPVEGLEIMAKRRSLVMPYKPTALCRGPGNLTQAMGIVGSDDHTDLLAKASALQLQRGGLRKDEHVLVTPRIGISKAKEVMWRFAIAGSPYVSGPKKLR